MLKKNHKKGFTLIEMLVVIAIIAVLVAIIIPTVTSSTTKAAAAVDAANLRSVLGALNSEILVNHTLADEYIKDMDAPESKYVPGAELYVVYTIPGIIDVYYKDADDNYYGLAYLADVAENGSSSISTEKPALSAGDTWYEVGEGEVPGT